MKKLFGLFALSSLCLATFTAGYASGVSRDVEDYVKFVTNFNAKSESLWPGFKLGKHPVILMSVAGNGVYAIDFKTTNTAWQKQTSGGKEIYFMRDDQIGAGGFRYSLDNPYFNLENQAVILSILEAPLALFADEFASYEVFDTQNGAEKLSLLKKMETVRDTQFNDPTNLTLLTLQIRALSDYISTRDEEALKNYVAIFETRNARLDDSARLIEVSAAELLPYRYLYLKSQATDDTTLARSIIEKLSTAPYSIKCSGGDLHDDLEDNLLGLSYALDHIVPGWQMRLEKNTISPSQLLAQHYPMSPQEIASRLQSAQAKYDSTNFITNRINTSCRNYADGVRSLLKRYEAQPGVEATFAFATMGPWYGTSIGIHSTYTGYAIDDRTWGGEEIQVGRSGNYGAMNNLRLYSSNSYPCDPAHPGIFYNWNRFCQKDARIKLPGDTRLLLDDKETTIAELVAKGQDVEFHRLSLTTNQANDPTKINLNSPDRAYLLTLANGQIKVDFK